MNRFVVALVGGLVVFNLNMGLVTAQPPFKKAWDDRYGKNYDPADLKVLTCNVCHVMVENKKMRNPYGNELHEELEKAGWKSDDVKEAVKEKEAKLAKLLKDFEKAMDTAEKKKTKEGDTYGDRIKAGKPPGG